MNDHDTTRMLERLAEAFPDQPAPLPDLLTAARAGQRRRSRTTLAAVAASVALVLAGGAVVQQVVSGDEGKPKPDQVAEPLPAPDGMRYVAMKRVAVAVPDSWGMQDTRCGQPVAATVYFTESATTKCLVKPDEPIPALRFIDSDSYEGRRLTSVLTTSATRNGLTVFEGSPCPESGFCTVVPYVVDTASHGVLISLAGAAAELPLRDQILDTLQLLPDGQLAVPYIEPGTTKAEAVEQLEAVGLATGRLTLDNAPVFGTDPVAGSIVASGSEIDLLLEPGREILSPETATQPLSLGEVWVDVPSSWVQDADDCNENFAGAAYLHEPGPRGDRVCGQVPSVLLISTLTSTGRSIARDSPLVDDTISGIPIRIGSSCSPTAACIYPDGTVMEVPGSDVVVLVAASPPDSPETLAIVGSLRVQARDPSRLNGTWEAFLSGITGGDGNVDTHRDATYTLTFADGEMSGDDRCNDLGANYTTVGRDLRFGSIQATQIGCSNLDDLVLILSQVRHVTGQGDEFHLHAENWGIVLTLRRVDQE